MNFVLVHASYSLPEWQMFLWIFSGVQFLRTLSRFKERKGNNLVLYEVSHKRVSHCGRAVDIQEILLKSVKHVQSC